MLNIVDTMCNDSPTMKEYVERTITHLREKELRVSEEEGANNEKAMKVNFVAKREFIPTSHPITVK